MGERLDIQIVFLVAQSGARGVAEQRGASVPLLTAPVTREASPGAAATGIVSLGLLGDPRAVPFGRRRLGSVIPELRWASAITPTRFGVPGQAVTDSPEETGARPPAPSETMSFLNGSYRRLTEIVLREITQGPAEQAGSTPCLFTYRCHELPR